LAFDREDTLKKAEKLLRQGRLDAAIAEYARVIEDQPRDWNTANTLGDLYARAGQPDKAIAQYTRIADHLSNEGFYPRAAAIFKKILKIKPDDESSQLQLGELSAKQGLLADAKSYFTMVADRRRARGDRAGSDEMVVRLGSLDPSDVDGRIAAARVLAQGGDEIAAAIRYRELHADLVEKGRQEEALTALREAVRLNPDDKEGRAELARAAIAANDLDTARTYLDRETAASDPALLLALATIELQGGALDGARENLKALLEQGNSQQDRVIETAWALADAAPDAAFVCIETVVDSMMAASAHGDAAALLQEFVTRVPTQIPALLRLVEVCVDGGLEAAMYETQAQLADAYLASDQAAEARVIAEDLVAREPWERAHIERFRRALVMLKVSDPDTYIAERLSGQAPFMATDPFVDMEPPAAPPLAAEEAAPAAAAPPAADREEPKPVPDVSQPAAQPAAPEAKPSGTPVEIDLTTILGDLQGRPVMTTSPDPENLDEVFEDFREEVSRQTGSDEAAQHLKLARTYLEMGMSDEAIGSLRTAARSPRHRFEAASMLGRLYRDQQDIPHAVEWLERAAEAPAPGAEEGRSLLYDLGVVLEEAGETARALAVFLELQSDAGDYRDVGARVDRLARVQAGG
jgi:tetratricopeptide (TPR) repeat protein